MYQSIRHYFQIQKDNKDLINIVKLMISKLKSNPDLKGSASVDEVEDYVVLQTWFSGDTKADIYYRPILECLQDLDSSYAIALYNSERGVDYGIYGKNNWRKMKMNGSFVTGDSFLISLTGNSKHWKTALGKKLKFPKDNDITEWENDILDCLLGEDRSSTIEIDNLYFRKEGFELVLRDTFYQTWTKESYDTLDRLLDVLDSKDLKIQVYLEHANKNNKVYANSYISAYEWDVLSFSTFQDDVGYPVMFTPEKRPLVASLPISHMVYKLEEHYHSPLFDIQVIRDLTVPQIIKVYENTFQEDRK